MPARLCRPHRAPHLDSARRGSGRPLLRPTRPREAALRGLLPASSPPRRPLRSTRPARRGRPGGALAGSAAATPARSPRGGRERGGDAAQPLARRTGAAGASGPSPRPQAADSARHGRRGRAGQPLSPGAGALLAEPSRAALLGSSPAGATPAAQGAPVRKRPCQVDSVACAQPAALQPVPAAAAPPTPAVMKKLCLGSLGVLAVLFLLASVALLVARVLQNAVDARVKKVRGPRARPGSSGEGLAPGARNKQTASSPSGISRSDDARACGPAPVSAGVAIPGPVVDP